LKKQAPRPGIVDHFETYCANDWLPIPLSPPMRLRREFKKRGFAGG
jgi:hypothetical protein